MDFEYQEAPVFSFGMYPRMSVLVCHLSLSTVLTGASRDESAAVDVVVVAAEDEPVVSRVLPHEDASNTVTKKWMDHYDDISYVQSVELVELANKIFGNVLLGFYLTMEFLVWAMVRHEFR